MYVGEMWVSLLPSPLLSACRVMSIGWAAAVVRPRSTRSRMHRIYPPPPRTSDDGVHMHYLTLAQAQLSGGGSGSSSSSNSSSDSQHRITSSCGWQCAAVLLLLLFGNVREREGATVCRRRMNCTTLHLEEEEESK